MRTTSIVGSGLVVSLVCGALLPAERLLPAAEARPAYAQKEKKECAFCHKNAKGGGPRTPKGDEYQKNGMKFADSTAFGEDGAFTTEANGKAFDLVRAAMKLEHWGEAQKRLTALKSKEKKGPGAQLVLNTEAQVDGKGRDLAKKAKDDIEGGRVPDAAEAIAHLEAQFKGREPAKEVSKLRTELARLPGGKEADAAAKAMVVARIAYLDALFDDAAGDRAGATRALEALCKRWPEGKVAEAAREKLSEWKGDGGAAMGD